MDKIDFVILWVNGDDPEWKKEKVKYTSTIPKNNKSNGENRYRDWGTLKYWFRGVEKYAPWVNKIHLVTCGHLPKWLNTENPKLHIVKHEEFMPKEILPTYNSNVIQYYLNNIPGLAEQFVMFDDDMFLTKPVKPTDFFKNGKPCDVYAEDVIAPSKYNDVYPFELLTNIQCINSYFNKKRVYGKNFRKYISPKFGVKKIFRTLYLKRTSRFVNIYNQHICYSFTKTYYKKFWKMYGKLIQKCSKHKFRARDEITVLLVRDLQFMDGYFEPRKLSFGKRIELRESRLDGTCKKIEKQKYSVLCINDSDTEINFSKAKKRILEAFEKILPEQSSFEKGEKKIQKKMIMLSQYVKNNLNAGPKAKVDIEVIVNREYGIKIKTIYLKNDEEGLSKAYAIYLHLKRCVISRMYGKKYDAIFIQSPYSKNEKVYKPLKNKITIIHDISGLRSADNETVKREMKMYNDSEVVVAHNDKMKQFLIDNGVEASKIINIELFDYLGDYKPLHEEPKEDEPVIVYTGNLDKAPFLHQIEADKMNFKINVYGVGDIEKINNTKIIYKGKFKPDELINHIEGNLGLVWDGNFDDSDADEPMKNYTKYNNPHKLSCYLAANTPVIVWSQSAVADFVKKENVGYVVDNLYEINDLDYSDFEVKKENAKRIGEKIRKGHYTKRAIEESLKKLAEGKDNV